jgi:hypothetical protein
LARFLAAKTIGGFRPIDEAGEEFMRRIKRGEVVSIEVKRPRNIQHHRLFWALMTIVWQNHDQERYPTVEDLVAAVKIAAGHRTRIQLPGGEVGFIPGSIAFHKMSQDDFGAFWERVVDLVCAHFLPGVTPEALRAEVENMTGLAAPEIRG